MNIRKSISIALVSSYLLSFAAPVLANASLEGERYEILEDDNVLVDNVLEPGKVDIGINGNTLVNSANYIDKSSFSILHGTVDDDGYIEIISNSDYRNFYLSKDVVHVKPNTKYTYIVDIIENTLIRANGNTKGCIAFGGTHGSIQPTYWNDTFSLDGGVTGTFKFILNTKNDFSGVTTGDRGFVDVNLTGKIKFRYMIIEGDYTDYDIDYFRGIKSVGQNEDKNLGVKVYSATKNLFNKNNVKHEFIEMNTGNLMPSVSGLNRTTDWIKCKPNTTYTVSGGERNRWLLKSSSGKLTYIGSEGGNGTPTMTTLDDTVEFKCYVVHRNTSLLDKIQIEEGAKATAYVPHVSSEKTLSLNEPLRGISDNVRDRIIKKDNRWYIERKVGKIKGSEMTKITLADSNDNYIKVRIEDLFNNRKNDSSSPIQNNVFSFGGVSSSNSIGRNFENIEVVKTLVSSDSTYNNHRGICYVTLSKTKAQDLNEAKQWLNNSDLTIIYELENPIYEPISAPLSLEVAEGATYVYIDSDVPTKISVYVDRALNKAIEYVAIAKANPTTLNISNARYWINLLNETMIKDQLQDEMNNAKQNDLELEKKYVTSSFDVYIKSENLLSMSLDTNAVTFEEYSGVEELEKLSAINITVNSSLPYNLNAYLPKEIMSNSAEVMDISVLKIRENSKSDYQNFINTIDKIVLKDNCEKGNDKSHLIDLKLASDLAHKADIYKTVLKFEIEQK